jgi:hypothetical protein
MASRACAVRRSAKLERGDVQRASSIPPDRRIGVDAVTWLVVILVLVVLAGLIGVFVQRRRRTGGVIATRKKR